MPWRHRQTNTHTLTQLCDACRWLHCSFQSACQNRIAKPTVIQNVQVSMLSGPWTQHYMGVHDIWSRLHMCTCILKQCEDPLNLHLFEFSLETHKLEVTSKPWESTTKTWKIPACETGIHNRTGHSALRTEITLEEEENENFCGRHKHMWPKQYENVMNMGVM